MTSLTAPRLGAPTTSFDRMLLATAAALDGFVVSRQNRRAATSELREYRRSAAESQRDRIGAVATGLLPR